MAKVGRCLDPAKPYARIEVHRPAYERAHMWTRREHPYG
jgi:hypothetical protein